MDEEKKNTILIVDDEITNLNLLIHALRNTYTLFVAKSGPAAIEMAKNHLPDLILLDIVMGEMDGYEVLRSLRDIEITQSIPVIFISGMNSQEDEEKGLALGVADYISKPFSPNIVKLRVRNQIRMINYLREIEHLSMTDALTGLSNRRSFNATLQREWGRAVRENESISMIILDIDMFKNFNDTYGHQHGDAALKIVAKVIVGTIKRPADFVARWGGEEFTVLLPSTDMDGAMVLAEEIRAAVEKIEIPHDDGFITRATISAGVSHLMPNKNSAVDKFISDADRALYSAKGQGRNRVVSAVDAM